MPGQMRRSFPSRAEEVWQLEHYAVELLHITKRFPGITAIDDITLQLKKGETPTMPMIWASTATARQCWSAV